MVAATWGRERERRREERETHTITQQESMIEHNKVKMYTVDAQ